MQRLPHYGRSEKPSRLLIALLVLLVWTAIGIFLGTVDVISGGRWPTVVNKVTEAWVWALLTPVIWFVNRKISNSQTKLAWRAGIMLSLSIPFSLAHTYIAAILLFPIKEITWSPLRDPAYATFYFLGGWGTYCAIIGALLAFEYYNRFLSGQLELERAEKQLLQSHLNVLRLQLEPHFLFNALNAISSEVAGNPELARDMIEDLGSLLRLSLDYQDRNEISLSQEITLLEHYLAIQKIRFGERLNVRMLIEPDVETALVPCMLLQPIVENAIRHGLGGRMSGGTVEVIANRANGHVEIRVRDNGVGLPPGWQMGSNRGLGLKVTRERLAGLYPDAIRHFDVHRQETGGTEVVMRIPLRTDEEVGS